MMIFLCGDETTVSFFLLLISTNKRRASGAHMQGYRPHFAIDRVYSKSMSTAKQRAYFKARAY